MRRQCHNLEANSDRLIMMGSIMKAIFMHTLELFRHLFVVLQDLSKKFSLLKWVYESRFILFYWCIKNIFHSKENLVVITLRDRCFQFEHVNSNYNFEHGPSDECNNEDAKIDINYKEPAPNFLRYWMNDNVDITTGL